MAINLPEIDVNDLALNPGKYIDMFRAREQEMRKEAYKYAKLRKHAEVLRDKQDEMTLWLTAGIPDPPERGSKPGQSRDEDGQDEDQVPRRIRVLQLLSGEPSRGWKVRTIADALGITNYKSLRVSLDEFALKDGILRKNDQAEYFFNPRAQEYLTKMSN
ncbi:hypothetical protein ATK36_3339 [Amycolatopsis sulphurea]|uniref:Uncharacterized protein n=1 Tax=Amycolatopsis sulphurea TaxID=76022 RepID=A0A2A9FCP0_9PSEU|nr:hypothetical protein [Amycolatopsis sulphurea]PFG48260.1 hypothetical protein ATK36_3339 [Amycolatopsis sulphurea]